MRRKILKAMVSRSGRWLKHLPLASCLLPFFSFAIALTALAQDLSFTATVDKRKVSLNSTLQVTFTLENADGKNFRPPSFADFSVLSGPNQSTSMQFINGSMSRSVSYSYYLKPNKEGALTIEPATIIVGGRTISSNSITIEVVKGTAQDQAEQQQNRGQDIYSQIRDNVFVKLSVNKKEVYQGEQVTATYKLYYRMTISNTSISKAPSYTGFWSQELDIPENIQFTPEVYNGFQYNAAVIKKDALFPQRPGELEIDPMELQTIVRVKVRSQPNFFFDDFFGTYQDYPYKFSSNSVKIKVKPLPTAGTPMSFNGAVGNYKMDVTLDKTQTKPDEPVALTIIVSGTGNIKMLDVPKINLPSDLEVYDPKTSEKISKRGDIISGSKTSEYLIIPRRAGQFKIPPVEFSYFDLSKQQYVVQQSPEYVINVEGTVSTSATPAISGITKEEVELLGEDIRYIKTGGRLKKQDEFLFATWQFAGVYAAPVLLFALLFAYKRREEKLSGNVALMKNRRANKEAAKRLKKAKQYLSQQNRKAFFDEISRAIWGYLGDKLNMDQASLSREQIQHALTQRNISPETIQRIFKTLDDAEMALFASSSDGEMNKSYSDATAVIAQLEEEL